MRPTGRTQDCTREQAAVRLTQAQAKAAIRHAKSLVDGAAELARR